MKLLKSITKVQTFQALFFMSILSLLLSIWFDTVGQWALCSVVVALYSACGLVWLNITDKEGTTWLS